MAIAVEVPHRHRDGIAPEEVPDRGLKSPVAVALQDTHPGVNLTGHSEVEDETQPWATGDFVYTPPWTWHRHYNDSTDESVEFLTIENSRLLGLLGLGRRQSAGLVTVKEARTQFGE